MVKGGSEARARRTRRLPDVRTELEGGKAGGEGEGEEEEEEGRRTRHAIVAQGNDNGGKATVEIFSRNVREALHIYRLAYVACQGTRVWTGMPRHACVDRHAKARVCGQACQGTRVWAQVQGHAPWCAPRHACIPEVPPWESMSGRACMGIRVLTQYGWTDGWMGKLSAYPWHRSAAWIHLNSQFTYGVKMTGVA
eukprot:366394-Chlamydomonas_euryale.AAC.1